LSRFLSSKFIYSFKWQNKNIETNREQKQAVKYIVNGTAYPAPYIIFGPPGTGKTSTIVEAICQLCLVDTKNRILITAQSNAACNEISERLLKYLKKEEMYRMFSKSSTASVRKTGNDKLMRASNMASRQHLYPTWDELYEYRVVICTLCTAGSLQLAGIDPKHFTHVFIDECASATEPSSLIAIAGLITTPNCINGHIILSGDIHQLGPVIRFKMAEKLGYGESKNNEKSCSP
jgi:helicase MOV-10